MRNSSPAYLNASAVACRNIVIGLGCIDTSGGIAVFSCFGRKYFTVERTQHIGTGGTVHHPLRVVLVTINRQFEQLGAFPETCNMTFVFPVFKIGRCINRVSVTFVQHHHPMFGRSIPEHFRVTCILRVPFLLGVNYRILIVLRECTSFVQTVCYSLHLSVTAGSREGSNHGGSLAFIESCGIIIVDYCRTGEHCSQMVGIQSVRQFGPMYQVLADCMAPVHVLPVSFERIMLVEQVILTFIINQSIRVIDPTSPGSKVELRTILFLIQTILSCDFIRLVYLAESFFIALIGYLDCFSFEGRYIFEYPILGFIRCQTNNDGQIRLAVYFKSHFRPIFGMRNREVQILLRYFKRYISCHCQQMRRNKNKKSQCDSAV